MYCIRPFTHRHFCSESQAGVSATINSLGTPTWEGILSRLTYKAPGTYWSGLCTYFGGTGRSRIRVGDVSDDLRSIFSEVISISPRTALAGVLPRFIKTTSIGRSHPSSFV